MPVTAVDYSKHTHTHTHAVEFVYDVAAMRASVSPVSAVNQLHRDNEQLRC